MGLIKIIGSGGDSVDTDNLNATADKVLSGYTYIGSDTGDSDYSTGTMPNNGALSGTLSTTTTAKTIPAGYTSGGTVSISLETKTATPTSVAQDITPTAGKVLSKVTVKATPTETKTITPSYSSLTITPTSGKFFSLITVSAIARNITTNDITTSISTTNGYQVTVAANKSTGTSTFTKKLCDVYNGSVT